MNWVSIRKSSDARPSNRRSDGEAFHARELGSSDLDFGAATASYNGTCAGAVSSSSALSLLLLSKKVCKSLSLLDNFNPRGFDNSLPLGTLNAKIEG